MPLAMGRTWHGTDCVSVIDCFDAMWNAHDLDAVIELFTVDAVVTIVGCERGIPKVFAGPEQIREMLRSWLPVCTIRSRSHHMDGGRVVWMALIRADPGPQLGVREIAAKCEAVVRGQNIASLTVSIPSEREARLECPARKGVVSPASRSRSAPEAWVTRYW